MDEEMKISMVMYLCGSIAFSVFCSLMTLLDEGLTRFILQTITIELLLFCLFLIGTRRTWVAFFSQYGSAWRFETELLLTRLPAVPGAQWKILELEFHRLPEWRERSKTNPHLYAPHKFARFAIKDFHEVAKAHGQSLWKQEEVDKVVA